MNWGIITGPDNPFVCTFFKNVKKKTTTRKAKPKSFWSLRLEVNIAIHTVANIQWEKSGQECV